LALWISSGSPIRYRKVEFHNFGGATCSRRITETILQELLRVGAITEVGTNVWKPLKQEYIEPSLSPVNLGRMASLVESLLATLENNTSSTRSGTDLLKERQCGYTADC